MTPSAPPTVSTALDSEKAVIGAMLTTRDACDKARSLLAASDFFSERTRTAFDSILALVDAGHREADLLLVAEHLRKTGTLDEIGGVSFLDECARSIATSDHVESYCRQVKEAALDRAIARQVAVTGKEQTPANVAKLGALIAERESLGAAPAFDFREHVGEGLEAIFTEPNPGIPTGFPQLDEFISLRPGDGSLIVVGSRTSVGKTAWMTATALNLAQRGVETLYITTEMLTKQMLARILPGVSGIPARRIRAHGLTDHERRHLIDVAAEKLSKLTLKIACLSRPSVADIRAAVVAHRPRVVILDYLQRLAFDPRERIRAYAVGDLMRDLKTMAQELRVAVVLGAQLDRGMDRAPTQPPTLADLRDSAGIEHEADAVVLLWRPPESELVKRPDWTPPPVGHVHTEALIAKNRDGAAGVAVDFMLNGELVQIMERSRQPQQEDFTQ